MNAFIQTDTGLFKVYRHGADWQVIGPDFERWFSVWSADERGSIDRAIDSVPGANRVIHIIHLS